MDGLPHGVCQAGANSEYVVMVVMMKAIKATRLDIGPVSDELFSEMKTLGFDLRREFNRPAKKFKGEKPRFFKETKRAIKFIRLSVYMEGSEEAINKWNWLDRGTDVRYATMSPDFVAKTAPRVLDSGNGKGRVLFVNKSRPKPGIKAREWRDTIHDEWEPKFQKRMDAAFARGARRTGHWLGRR